MQTQLELAIDLGYLEKKNGSELMEQALEVGRILNGLLRSLRAHAALTGASCNSANSANSANTANSAF